MKASDLLLEAPKKKAAKKKGGKDKYKPQMVADIDLQDAALSAAKKVATLMKSKCQPWLKATNNGSLMVYRGISDRSGLAFTKKTRDDRRPKDTDQELHRAFNAAIKAAGGVANRTNALFATGDRHQAQSYGKTYVLIPVGPFKYTWSIQWSDWTGDTGIEDFEEMLKAAEPDAEDLAEIKRLEAQIPAYKKKLEASIENDYAKEVASLKKKIESAKKKVERLKAQTKNPKSLAISNAKEDLAYVQRRLKEVSSPEKKKQWMAQKVKDRLRWDMESPARALEAYKENLSADTEGRTDDPKSYDPKKVKEVILADQKLSEAIKAGMEIMIHCSAGLYVDPYFYEYFVLPTLRGKKVSRNFSYGDLEDNDNSW